MVGILCEKPSAAKNFAKALGGSKGRFADTDYQIVNALGHLYEMIWSMIPKQIVTNHGT